MPYHIEVTDTFGGEANYCWVKRGTTQAIYRRPLVKAVKDLAGWTGWCRVNIETFQDGLIVRPSKSSGVCEIAFVTWVDEE
jgi:hypothetical protein